MQTPVLFIIYNRIETARQVFEKIKNVKPKYLYVSADGPKDDEDKEKTDNVRNLIKEIDWDCELKTNFKEKNIGCGEHIIRSIKWLFENEEQGIILEDDCKFTA